MHNIIEIRHLYKNFKDVKAVQDLSFRVKKGELFAFLGVNGAGKSTTISIICGQLEKDGGEVLIDGVNIDENILCNDIMPTRSAKQTRIIAVVNILINRPPQFTQ